MKSLMLFWQQVAEDLGDWCCTSTTRDIQTVTRRLKDEGVSFLTITLPSFGKDLQKGLDQGYVDRDLFNGFRWKAGLPQFLGGFLDLIFDRASGKLLDEPSSDAIYAIRQLTLMYNKIELECTERRMKAAFTGFIECEKELKSWDSTFHSNQPLREQFERISALLFRDIFTEMDREIYHKEILPKHGPGKTAEKIVGNDKFRQVTWPDRLDDVFRYVDFAVPNHRYAVLEDRVQFLEPGSETPVRVVAVPKTLKTPRIIAIEPVAMQYMQQGIMERFIHYLETHKVGNQPNIVQGMIGFTSQELNQQLAMKGSQDGSLATLDLSEASDRVSNQLAQSLFSRWPWLNEAVQATRSRKADVNGQTVRLSKFASMGSALCFPLEAMVFLTVVFCGIEQELNRQITRRDITFLRQQVRIYGDDIIVPVEYVHSVNDALRTFGFRVNIDKSYWNGRFRESCGKEYYAGTDVSIVRVRRVFPTSRQNVPEIVSMVSLRNQMYKSGLWKTAKMLDEQLLELLGHFPTVHSTSPALGRHSFLGFETQRLCPELHKPLVRAWVVKSKSPVSRLDGPDALLKWFLKRGDEPFADEDHLERSGRPDAVYIKLRWSSAV
jgi:hypothetical protein